MTRVSPFRMKRVLTTLPLRNALSLFTYFLPYGHVAEWLRSGLQILCWPFTLVRPGPDKSHYIQEIQREFLAVYRSVRACAIRFGSKSGSNLIPLRSIPAEVLWV